MHDVTLFVAVHSPMSRYCSITFSVTAVSQQCLFILEMWTVQLREILNVCPCKLECAYVAYIGAYFRILDNDAYDKVVRNALDKTVTDYCKCHFNVL